jgi:hypothetical protein
MAHSARTKRTTAPAPAPAADSSDDDDDDRSGDADETKTNEESSDPDQDPESGTEEAGPIAEPVTPFTMKRELTREYYESVLGLNRTASYAL